MGQESADFHPNSAFPDCNSSFELTDGYEMMHKAWSNIEEVLYCFQGHPSNTNVALKQKIPIVTRIRAFPDCNFSLNWPMAKK